MSHSSPPWAFPITTGPVWKCNSRSGGSESCLRSHPALFWGFRLSSPLTYLKGWLDAVSFLPFFTEMNKGFLVALPFGPQMLCGHWEPSLLPRTGISLQVLWPLLECPRVLVLLPGGGPSLRFLGVSETRDSDLIGSGSWIKSSPLTRAPWYFLAPLVSSVLQEGQSSSWSSWKVIGIFNHGFYFWFFDFSCLRCSENVIQNLIRGKLV